MTRSMHLYESISICIYLYPYLYRIYVSVSLYLYLYLYLSTSISFYIHSTSISIYLYMYIYIYIYREFMISFEYVGHISVQRATSTSRWARGVHCTQILLIGSFMAPLVKKPLVGNCFTSTDRIPQPMVQ